MTGGETARAVLDARGIREYTLRSEVEPGVPFGMARDGTLICTKAGAFGGPDSARPYLPGPATTGSAFAPRWP